MTPPCEEVSNSPCLRGLKRQCRITALDTRALPAPLSYFKHAHHLRNGTFHETTAANHHSHMWRESLEDLSHPHSYATSGPRPHSPLHNDPTLSCLRNVKRPCFTATTTTRHLSSLAQHAVYTGNTHHSPDRSQPHKETKAVWKPCTRASSRQLDEVQPTLGFT